MLLTSSNNKRTLINLFLYQRELFSICAQNTQLQFTFLALQPCATHSIVFMHTAHLVYCPVLPPILQSVRILYNQCTITICNLFYRLYAYCTISVLSRSATCSIDCMHTVQLVYCPVLQPVLHPVLQTVHILYNQCTVPF